MDNKLAPLACLIVASAVLPAHATLQISNKPTKNTSCSAGVCTATAANAVMNAGDIATMLESSDLRVVTDGEFAQDMIVAVPVAWATTHALTLEANDTIFLRNTITVEGTAHLDLKVSGGPFFETKGAVRFWDTKSRLTVDGQDYTLVNSIAGLAAAVAKHPDAWIALASDYNAKPDRQYTHVPVPTAFAGTFEGLGNTISNLSIWDSADTDIGLFAFTKGRGELRDVRLRNVDVLAENTDNNVAGGLVGHNEGTIFNCQVDGGTVRTDFRGTVGGLAGLNYGSVYSAWANVSVEGATAAEAGGLIGNAHGHVQNVYAMGRVIAGDNADVGGLIGYNIGHVRYGYSTGRVSGGQSARVGGSMGSSFFRVRDVYWDTETSGTENGVGGTNIEGVTGKTTQELQAAIPNGFSLGSWAQSPKINSGYPYLFADPPR